MVRARASLVVLLMVTGCLETKRPGAGLPASPPEGSCGAPIEPGPRRDLVLGGRAAQQDGARLVFSERDADGRLVLGVLGPINEDSGLNLLALGRYRAYFAERKVDAIVVTGDVGEDPHRISRVLGELALSGVPVLVVIGNTESRADFAEGLREAQKRFPNIVDLTGVRTVQFPELSLVSLPGYFDPAFVKAKGSCLYSQAMIDEVMNEAKRLGAPVGLVTHGPPKGQGTQAIDWARTLNAGDPAMTLAISSADIRFGFFSNIKEAGGHATKDAAGAAPLKEGEPSSTLFLNPGPADTTPWEMNDHTRSFGMASLFTLEGNQASYEVFRLGPPTAAEKAEAKGLEAQPR